MDKAAIYNQLVNTPVNGVYGIDVGQKTLSEGRPSPVVQGEDGQMYKANEYLDENGNWQTNPDFSTPVYYFHQPLEAGDARGNYAEYSDDLQSAEQQGYWRTEEEIKAYWDGEGATDMNMFQQTNPDMDFDTYMSFIKDNSALYGQGITPESDPEAFAGITEKHGIQTSTTDNDNVYGWNGSNYTKTFKPEDPNYGRMLWAAGLGAMGGQALGGYLSGLAGSSLPAGVAGPSAPLLSPGVAKGLAAGATNAASQGILTGSIDPGSVLSSAVIAGFNPGAYVADNYAPWKNASGDLAFGGAPPSSFYGGLVSGTVNDIVKNGLVNGELDLQGSLEKGLVSGGINSALNTWDEWKGNSQEAIADRLQYTDPTLSRADALEKALADPLLNTTDFGALIGKDGLFSSIPRADLTFLRNITDPIGDGLSGLLNGFKLDDVMQLPDGTTIPMKGMTDAEYQNYTLNEGGVVVESKTAGLLSNPVVDGLADALGLVLPSGDGSLSEDLQAQKDQFAKEWEDVYGYDYGLVDKNGLPTGQLTVAGQAAKNNYIQTKMDTLGSFFFENAGGLNENYSWSENPRGQSELWGTMVGVPGLYSTGAEPSYLPNGWAGVISPPLKPDGTPVTPLNFGPEFINTEAVAAIDPSNAVLPSNNDSAIRNQTFFDYVGMLGGNKDSSDSTSSSSTINEEVVDKEEVKVTTANIDDSNKSEVVGTAAPPSTGTAVDTTPVYGLAINGDDTVTLPSGATVPANIADSVMGQMYPSSEELAPSSSTTLPSGGGSVLPGLLSNYRGGNDGLPPIWTELNPYKPFRGYTDKRKKLYTEMMAKLGTIEPDKGWLTSAFNPRLKELEEAGLIK
jgi:hypothetical protein